MERDCTCFLVISTSCISTHTLTWSVTGEIVRNWINAQFQLTRSRGAWLCKDDTVRIAGENFNSHAHVERDLLVKKLENCLILFQLTRSRGAWLFFFRIPFFSVKFQLTRSRGAWPFLLWLKTVSDLFQLTRSRGAWRMISSSYRLIYAFQLTRSRGAWLKKKYPMQPFTNFNSHAHVERDGYVRKYCQNYIISTHTLTWSVTSSSPVHQWYLVFQLTRSRGAWPGIFR